MKDMNNFCEVETCGQEATVFGLKGTSKVVSCNAHIPTLVSKQMTIYSISARSFISSSQDAVLYEDRKAAVERGLCSVGLWEANCDSEFSAALETIERERQAAVTALEAAVSDVRAQVERKYREAKQELAALRRNLELYITEKAATLTPTAEIATGGGTNRQKFIEITVTDSAKGIAQAVKKDWRVRSSESLLTCGAEATRGEREEPSPLGEAGLLSRIGRVLLEEKRLPESLECYSKALHIYEAEVPYSVYSVHVLCELVTVYRQLRRDAEAEEHYRQAKEKYERIKPGFNLKDLEAIGIFDDAQREAIELFKSASLFLSQTETPRPLETTSKPRESRACIVM